MIECPECKKPLNVKTITTVLREEWTKKKIEMEQADEDVYESEKYQSLKILIEATDELITDISNDAEAKEDE